ncbi:hypothetical protein Q2941_41620 [Bradyrhizobium sp. UFLA05-153]
MFQRIIDGISASTGRTLRLTSLAAAAALALFITTAFLCAAVFILVLQNYGPVQACLAGAGVFFLLTLAAAGSYIAYKRETEKRARQAAEKAARSAAQSMLSDPMLIATGLQIVRAIGVKRLLPILAIGGVALGIMASRAGTPEEEASPEPAE